MQEFPADGILICPMLHGVPSKGFANLRDVFPAVAFARQVPGVDYVGIDNARGAPPTAVLCFNDVVALGAMEGIQRLGLKPGIDFGVVGFNNIPEAAQCVPALTTIDNSPRQLGEAAAELLLKRIEQRVAPIRTLVLQPQLIVRESCGANFRSQTPSTSASWKIRRGSES
jgi:DNA-binding LacI/PurR family transcriptional regulator